ncbi:MAG: arsenite methyltransferase [Promethearchaeota archaeon]
MTQEKEKKIKIKKKETASSCCSFSNTEALLKKLSGESLIEPSPEISNISCDCEIDTPLSSERSGILQNQDEIKKYVKKRYASLISQSTSSCCGPSISYNAPGDKSMSDIDLGNKQKFIKNLGYTEVELQDLPDDVTNISFGCGNPTAIAELKPGEVVLDLGSGGGIDVFLAAKKVGPTGKSIGLDMTPEMIERANANAKKMGLENVEFKLGEMENMPLTDNSVDVIISNCVINLSPDKSSVFQEIFRVLKPGGRMVVSDIVLNGSLPEFIKHDFEAWAGCVAGALQEEDYLQKIKNAKLINIKIESKRSAKELLYTIKQDPHIMKKIEETTSSTLDNILGRIVSIKVKAYKPK